MHTIEGRRTRAIRELGGHETTMSTPPSRSSALPWVMAWTSTIYRRAELYEQVWAEPMVKVAARYGVSNVALAKTCRRLGIPVPTRGYWAKVRAGAAQHVPPLPPADPGVPDELELEHVVPDEPRAEAPLDPRVAFERTPAARVVVPESLDEAHALVRSAKRLLVKSKRDGDGMHHVYTERCLNVQASPAALDRALRIVQALISACVSRKMVFEVTRHIPYDERRFYDRHEKSNVTRFKVDGEWIELRVRERWSILPAEEPPRKLTGVELIRWQWDHRAEHVPNGVLELRLQGPFTHAMLADSKANKLEGRLNQVLERAYALAADARRWRDENAAGARRAEEEAEERRRAEAEAAEERRRLSVMTESVQAWRFARDIREYVREARMLAQQVGLDATTSPNLMATLDWASSYAERSDPMHALRGAAAKRRGG